MLFNSAEFLFLFLPVVGIGYFLIGRLSRPWSIIWLVLSSLYFYADWKPEYLWIILASIVGNFFLGRAFAIEGLGETTRKGILAAGVAANLAALGYYKYADFIVENVSAATGVAYALPNVVLPLAISFFTFQQIAYLCDAYRGLCREHDFGSYCLFVTFFPQLIAGPIVHHSEMLPQFGPRGSDETTSRRLAIGLTILGIGLFKKVVIADGVAPYSTAVFSIADSGGELTAVQAWGGALAYTFQLYFDFSGYSDMAVGAARLFGITLPMNFFSPYKSENIIEFWRRWHITLSRFLRDYLYISLGGNRRGRARRYANLMITMVLGGIWHGAGWNFLIWGALHGGYLMCNHAWRAVRGGLLSESTIESTGYRLVSWAITFLVVVLGWVFFRAESFDGAMSLLQAMFWPQPSSMVAGPEFGFFELAVLGLLLIAVTFLPNTYELMREAEPVLDLPSEASSRVTVELRWKPNVAWAAALGLVASVSLLHLGRVSEFLYFQF